MMKITIFNRTVGLLLSVLGMFFCTSCGYHMGSMMHPQIKSIAIAEIRNDAKEPNLTPVVRNQLAAQFQTDGSLKLKRKGSADCILYCRIKDLDIVPVRYESSQADDAYHPAEFRITVNAEFTVLIPGRSEPLIPMRSVSGTTTCQFEGDPNVGRFQGMKQATYELARLIVQYTTEAW